MDQTPPFAISTSTGLLGVTGWPVEHSLSPVIHNAALRAAGLDFVYLAFPIEPERFETAVRGLAAAGMVGLNCTVPHKYAALAICDDLAEEARLVGAVNTLHFRDGRIHGANTDVEGYVLSLRRDTDFYLEDRTVVQFGAGGAGRGMALGAIQAGAEHLVLVNRTVEKAHGLARDLLELFPKARITVLSSENDAKAVRDQLAEADLVANATSLGLNEDDPFPCDPQDCRETSVVFDAAYTSRGSTSWLSAARARGCETLDGLGMLVRQGAASFRIWTGVEPDLAAMFQALRDHE